MRLLRNKRGFTKPLRARAGFTLLEVLIVIVILGVIAGLAIPVYTAQVERARGQEALQGLGAMRESALRYFSQNTTYATMTLANMDYNANTAVGGQTVHFTYALSGLGDVPPTFTITARRTPTIPGGTISITQAGATTFGSAYQ